jgi:ribosomal protein S18 acetylase RimI-like enzyme
VILLRAATVADAHAIADLHVRAWRAAYDGLLPRAMLDGLSVAQRTAMWSRNASDPEAHVVVAQSWADAAGIVGFVAYGACRDDDAAPDTGEIYALYVEPDRIGTGLGRTLLGHAEADLRARGCRAATLWALAANQRARRFYERA